MEKKGKQERISGIDGFFMLGVALLFDGFQFLLIILVVGIFLNPIVGIVAWLTFYLWFTMKGVSFSDTRKSITLLLAGIVEVMPGLDVLPAWTLSTFLIISLTRLEDQAVNLKTTLDRKKIAEKLKVGRSPVEYRNLRPSDSLSSSNQNKAANDENYQTTDKGAVGRQRVPLQNISYEKNLKAANENVHNQNKAA